jgi:hypothetical protein
VHEPKEKGWEQIDKYIRLGLHWAVCAQFPKYTKNGQFQWCGAFAAWCYFNVGLKQSLRVEHLASTYRLHKWSEGNARRIAPKDLQPGDIAVVRTSTKKPKSYGDHITIVREVPKGTGTILTTEGNGVGTGPDGKTYEGVVHRTWKLTAKPEAGSVLYGVRPLKEDYEK